MEKPQAHTTTAPGLMIFEKPQGVMGWGMALLLPEAPATPLPMTMNRIA